MVRTPVTSSNIASIGYDAKSKVLEVEFNTGWVYQYFYVPQSMYNELLAAPSIGKYFATEIKPNYTFVQVGCG